MGAEAREATGPALAGLNRRCSALVEELWTHKTCYCVIAAAMEEEATGGCRNPDEG